MRRVPVPVALLAFALAAPVTAAAAPPRCAPLGIARRAGPVVLTHGKRGLPRRVHRLRAGDFAAVHRGGRLVLGSRRWHVRTGQAGLRIRCRATGPELELRWGALRLEGPAPLVRTRDARVDDRGAAVSTVTLERPRTVVTELRGTVRVRSRGGTLRADQPGDVVWVFRRSLPRFDIWPFARPLADRPARASDGLPGLYADGRGCTTGCRPRGAHPGWPLAPFHREHPLRAGFNELRPGSMHVGIDIQSAEQQAVYAIQPGRVEPIADTGPDARLRVGDYIYWHVDRSIGRGARVIPFHTLLGHVLPGFKHLHLTEVRGGNRDYVMPLRPGGRDLFPLRESAPPVIGPPRFTGGGRVTVKAFDPQTFRRPSPYHTPVLAVAGLAWRLDRGPLEWSYRGVHLADFHTRWSIFARDSYPPGFTCFYLHVRCIPNWDMVLAGGYTPGVPVRPGRHVLHIYAWDWAGNRTVRDVVL